MAYTLEQRAALAKSIDAALMTTAGTTDGAVIDLLLDWVGAAAKMLREQAAEIVILQNTVTKLVAADIPPPPASPVGTIPQVGAT